MKCFSLDHTNDVHSDNIDVLRQELQELGATHVLTYDELDNKKTIKAKVKEWTNGQVHVHSISRNICVLILHAVRMFSSV
jgi:hypothetical protein